MSRKQTDAAAVAGDRDGRKQVTRELAGAADGRGRSTDPVLRREESVRVVIDGEEVPAYPGQTVAAALLASGRDSWRTTRQNGRPRGVFCGIGACFDCLVTVNGIPDVRACQRTIVAEDNITTQQGAALPTRPSTPPVPSSTASSAQQRRPGRSASEGKRVVVVGAGPAGIAAALAAADAGAHVVLIDAGRAVGGQFHRQLPLEFHAARPERLQHDWQAFAEQRDRIADHRRITHLPETSVWALEPLPTPLSAAPLQAIERASATKHRVWVQVGLADAPGREVRAVDADALVLATGAYDRVLPFPGWDLPGVYSAGAAQALAKGQRVAVGQRVLLAGTGPFLLPVAESLLGVGADVLALLEANRWPTTLKGWWTDPMVATGKFKEALGYAALLGRHRIPVRTGRTVIAAHGTDRVEAVTVAKLDDEWWPIPGSERRVEVDAVCLGFGFTAQLELAISARCKLGAGPDGGPAVLVDADQQTSVPNVYAAGELTGVGGAPLAAAEGRVAGLAAACALGATDQPRPGSPTEARQVVARGKRFAQALAKAYPVKPGWRSWSDGGTVICRCEEVTKADLMEAVEARELTPGRSLKLTSRAGLGLCQGRVCARAVADLTNHQTQPNQNLTNQHDQKLSKKNNQDNNPDPAAAHNRPVVVPIRLRDLAAAETQEDQ